MDDAPDSAVGGAPALLPTLMLKGKLRSPTGDAAEQARLAEVVGIDYILDWFRERWGIAGIDARVLVLKSETASGKSTVLPPYLYKRFIKPRVLEGARPAGLICTQPKILTAKRNVFEMMDNYKFLKIGEDIGYSTGHDKWRPKAYGILSATVGTLTAQLQSMTDDEIIALYRFIIIDETHERNLETDFTISLLKGLLTRNVGRVDCPFVVMMSATFVPQDFLTYFGVGARNYIWCEGATAGFDEIWNVSKPVANYVVAAMKIVEKIVRDDADEPNRGDILIFVPGRADRVFDDLSSACKKLNEKFAAEKKHYAISYIEVDSEAVKQDTREYMSLAKPLVEQRIKIRSAFVVPTRRLIISTNVAETGVTLPELKYVIDAGYNKGIEYNPVHDVSFVVVKAAPKSRITQRRGRAGRKFRGVFYPLYSLGVFKSLPDIQYPDIITSDLMPIILPLIIEQIKAKQRIRATPAFAIADLDMLTPPCIDGLTICMDKLYGMGFISPIAPAWRDPVDGLAAPMQHDWAHDDAQNTVYGPTALGALAATFSKLPLESVRMILAGFSWGVSLLDLISIAAYLQIKISDFKAPSVKKEGSKNVSQKPEINWDNLYKYGLGKILHREQVDFAVAKLLLSDGFIDGLMLFNSVFLRIERSEGMTAAIALEQLCEQCNLSVERIYEYIGVRDEIINQMISARFNIFVNESQSFILQTKATWMNTITKIKYCIYDGYRANICTRGEDGEYKTRTGLSVNISGGSSAAIVLYNNLNAKQGRKTIAFKTTAERVCVLDGFVASDFYFLK